MENWTINYFDKSNLQGYQNLSINAQFMEVSYASKDGYPDVAFVQLLRDILNAKVKLFTIKRIDLSLLLFAVSYQSYKLQRDAQDFLRTNLQYLSDSGVEEGVQSFKRISPGPNERLAEMPV